MAHFQNGNARIYYEDVGTGEAIISNHGLAEDTSYWGATGVTAALAEKYRVVSMDMRGHGRTEMLGEPYGYDEVTMGADFDALADHLGIGMFHMLSHATGGMLAARYGIRHSDRLLSLMLRFLAGIGCRIAGDVRGVVIRGQRCEQFVGLAGAGRESGR